MPKQHQKQLVQESVRNLSQTKLHGENLKDSYRRRDKLKRQNITPVAMTTTLKTTLLLVDREARKLTKKVNLIH